MNSSYMNTSEINKDALDQWWKKSADEMLRVTNVYQTEIKLRYPDAKEMFITNDDGETTHVAVFNAPLGLNRKFSFYPPRQFSPQLLGGRLFLYRDDYFEGAKVRIVCNAWLAAASQCLHGIVLTRTIEQSIDPYERILLE